jgi:uncharacterized repeat protein (TIGR03803 family)
MRKKIISRQYEKAAVAATFAVVFLLGTVPAPRAQAQTLTVLHTFTGSPDGLSPLAGLVRDWNGNLYGTTVFGGAYGWGTVFKVGPTGKETVLYSFTNSPDGSQPHAGLVMDEAGNLYGTTISGGSSDAGTVFEVDTSGNETVLHSFTNSPDGAAPVAGLVRDWKGNLYGTTPYGGDLACDPPYGCGTVFKLGPTGKETVLYSFTNSPDGAVPEAGLVMDEAGNLYGTTVSGGSSCCGTVFKVAPTGKETVLHSFSFSDGSAPSAGLVRDWKGNLYGTTVEGGSSGVGTVFIMDPTGKETVLYSFAGGTAGAYPYGALVRDWNGNLYGTTFYGGDLACSAPYGCGTVFKLGPTGKETVLHSFTGSSDGLFPFAGLVMDEAGNLYGTTMVTVFKLTYCRAQRDQPDAEEHDENGGEEQ